LNVLGINSVYHESSAALLVDGKLVAAVEEERFNRIKHGKEANFDNPHQLPERAIRFCLKSAGLTPRDIHHVAFSFDPKRRRKQYRAEWWDPRFEETFHLRIGQVVGAAEELLGRSLAQRFHFVSHHLAHAASAYFPSGFDRAAVLTIDGIGETAGASLAKAEGERVKEIEIFDYPHSMGFLWEVFSGYLGFSHYDASKTMGLAAYGNPDVFRGQFQAIIRSERENFGIAQGFLGMTPDSHDKLVAMFGPPRYEDGEIQPRHADIAAALQEATDAAVMALVRRIKRLVPFDNLCLAGGVALNCVANGRLLREGTFRDIWIQPAAGDAGGAIGAALAGWHLYGDAPREVDGDDRMRGSFLGPSFGEAEIKDALDRAGARYRRLPEAEMLESVAASLAEGAVVGWFQGRMEFGPRALGNRSILGDPRNSKMQSVMNLKIKYRESFRPFAPAVLVERTADYFELDRPSPYMGLVAKVREDLRLPMSDEQQRLFGIDRLNVPRSSIPAVTHVDYSARIQSVDARTNPRFHRLIERFAALSGCAVLVNTSFNVRGEPIVCTPEDAYRCFMRTEMDVLAVGDFLLVKSDQPERPRDESWKREFELD